MYMICGFSRLPDGHSGAASAEVDHDFLHVVSESEIVEYVAGKIIEIAKENEETVSHAVASRIAPKIIESGSMIWDDVEGDEGTFITIDKVGPTELVIGRSLRAFAPQVIKSLIKDIGEVEEEEDDESLRSEMYVITRFSRLPAGHSGASPAEVELDFVHVVRESKIVEYITCWINKMAEENEETVSHDIAVRIAPKIIDAGSMTWEPIDEGEGSFISIDKVEQTEHHINLSLIDFKPQDIKSLIENEHSERLLGLLFEEE